MRAAGSNLRWDGFSQLPQPLQRFQDSLDLVGAFFVFAAEEGGEGFGIRSYDTLVVSADEFAEDGDLVGEAVGPCRSC